MNTGTCKADSSCPRTAKAQRSQKRKCPQGTGRSLYLNVWRPRRPQRRRHRCRCADCLVARKLKSETGEKQQTAQYATWRALTATVLHFPHRRQNSVCVKMFFLLTAVQKYKNQTSFSRVMITNVLACFCESQCC